jgi:multiple sugar transport system substrate-binding protein
MRALGAVLALCLAACSGAPREPRTELQFWAMGREGEVVRQLLPEFERRHPGVTVKVQNLAWTAAHAKLLTAFAADALPDVFQLGNTWLPEFAQLGALQPLDARVAASSEVRADDYFPGIWDTNRIGGALFGVPWYIDTRLLYYRSDVLAKLGYDHPPRDWDEWRAMMAAIKRDVGPSRYAILLPLNEFEPQLALLLQQDDAPLREDGRYGNFASAGGQRALGFYAEMFARGWAPPVTNTQISNVWVEFGRGYYAFYVSGPWNIAEFKKRLPPELKDVWSTAPLPGPDGPGASIAGGSSLVMGRRSEHGDLAWALIEYLSEPSVQREFHRLLGDLPPRRSSWDDAALAGDKYAAAYREQLERVKPTPKVPEWEQIAQELRVVSERLVHGEFDVAGAARELDARADAILEKRRWMLERAGPAAP